MRGVAVGFLPDGYASDLKPNDPLDWDAQAGAPHGVSSSENGPRSGGTYSSPVARGGSALKPTQRAADHRPFKLAK